MAIKKCIVASFFVFIMCLSSSQASLAMQMPSQHYPGWRSWESFRQTWVAIGQGIAALKLYMVVQKLKIEPEPSQSISLVSETGTEFPFLRDQLPKLSRLSPVLGNMILDFEHTGEATIHLSEVHDRTLGFLSLILAQREKDVINRIRCLSQHQFRQVVDEARFLDSAVLKHLLGRAARSFDEFNWDRNLWSEEIRSSPMAPVLFGKFIFVVMKDSRGQFRLYTFSPNDYKWTKLETPLDKPLQPAVVNGLLCVVESQRGWAHLHHFEAERLEINSVPIGGLPLMPVGIHQWLCFPNQGSRNGQRFVTIIDKNTVGSDTRPNMSNLLSPGVPSAAFCIGTVLCLTDKSKNAVSSKELLDGHADWEFDRFDCEPVSVIERNELIYVVQVKNDRARVLCMNKEGRHLSIVPFDAKPDEVVAINDFFYLVDWRHNKILVLAPGVEDPYLECICELEFEGQPFAPISHQGLIFIAVRQGNEGGFIGVINPGNRHEIVAEIPIDGVPTPPVGDNDRLYVTSSSLLSGGQGRLTIIKLPFWLKDRQLE